MATPRVHETSLDAANKYTERAMEHLRDKGYEMLGYNLVKLPACAT